MTIRNADGAPFRLKASLQQFDPADPMYELFNSWDEEVIRIGGSPVYYHEVLIQFNTVDRLYLEDRSKLFSPQPVELFAYYEPPQQSTMSGLFSVDTPDEEVIFELNARAVLRDIGHPPKIGSRIFTPHRGEHWIVIDRRLDQFKGWQALRMQLQCKKFQETRTSGEGKIGTAQADFKINEFVQGEDTHLP